MDKEDEMTVNIATLLQHREYGNTSYNVQVMTSERTLQDRNDLPNSFSLSFHLLSQYAINFVPIPTDRLRDLLQSLYDEVMKSDRPDGEDCAASRLVSFGHVETLLTILVQDILGVRTRKKRKWAREGEPVYPVLRCPENLIMPVAHLLQIVHECLKQCPNMTILHLATNYELLEVLFSLLTTQFSYRGAYQLRECVVAILDSILCSENDAPPVHLKLINGLGDLLKSQTGTQDTHLYHVLSAMLSVSEFNAIAHSSLEKYDTWIVESGFSDVMASNHRFLLDQPHWLEHMCLLVCRRMDEVARSVEAISQIFQRLELQEAEMEAFNQAHFRDHDGLFYQILLYKEKALRGDIFLLLSLLLSGKFRDEVQGRLVKCECLKLLPEVFHQVVWVVFQGHSNLLIQGSAVGSRDECCLDMFVRIQFLRFIYSIADNHRNRYLLLSNTDVEKLREVAQMRRLEFPESLQELVDQDLFIPSNGVLMQLITALRQEPASSCVRFWITRALEAFLRGETISLNQAFLLEQNLVEDTVSLIISGCVQNEMVMQGSFDFLSTLMKFNLQAFERCNRILDCTDKLTTLIRLTAENLVDSNMFLRCIILTSSYIKEKNPEKIDFLKKCRLLQFFSKVEKQVDFAVKLNRLLTVATLSQENVSCLNTSLLIMILAHRRKELPHCLRMISDMDDGFKLLTNMKNLLSFWITHYTLPIKKADCKSLETSTAIMFSEWQLVVNRLLDADAREPEAIEHYLQKMHIHDTGRRITPQSSAMGRLS